MRDLKVSGLCEDTLAAAHRFPFDGEDLRALLQRHSALRDVLFRPGGVPVGRTREVAESFAVASQDTHFPIKFPLVFHHQPPGNKLRAAECAGRNLELPPNATLSNYSLPPSWLAA